MTKVEPKLHVQENSQIKDIYSKLNSVQKKAIVLFDTDRNGIMDSKEAKAFNSSIFSEQANGDLDVYLQLSSGKKQKTTVRQNEFDNTVLSLEQVKNEKVENRNGKNVRVIMTSDALQKKSASSRNQNIRYALMDYGREWKKGATDKNGNTKYTTSYTAEDGSYKVNDYKILDITGNILEEQETLQQAWEDGCWVYGKRVLKDGKESYYDTKGSLVGTIEHDKNGLVKYSDRNGNCLYYTDGANYYDKNKKLKYTIEMADDPLNYPSKAIVYDDNGNVKSTKTVYMPLGDIDIHQEFHELSERYIGRFEDQSIW